MQQGPPPPPPPPPPGPPGGQPGPPLPGQTPAGRAPEITAGLQKPRRPRRLPERPLPWLIGSVAAFLVLFALAFLLFNSIKSGNGAAGRGAFTLTLIIGILALLLILATSSYTLRKRRRSLQEGMPGTMMSWFKAHIWLGLLAFGAAVAHVLTRPISSNLTTGKLTLIVFLLLVLSGVGWRLVYRRTPRQVSAEVGNLAVADTQKRIGEIQIEIDKTTAGRSPQFQSLVSMRLAGTQPPQVLEQQAFALPEDERADWLRISKLSYDRDRYLQRVGSQQQFARFLQVWRMAHWPLAAILFGLVVVHIFDVFGAGRIAFGGAAREFPSSESCANCHSQIANDWKQSVMSHAVTSPVMVAQVKLAVQKNIENGTPLGTVCTACHGPIGVELIDDDEAQVLPFPGTSGSSDPYATGKRNRVLAEGITCVVCHALDAAPPPGSGKDGIPVNRSGLTSLGRFTGPDLGGGPPIPVADHQTVIGGYLANDFVSSDLCGACHVVAVDLDGGGVDRLNVGGDLVLQTTYLEWKEDFVSQDQFAGIGCVTCHAQATPGPVVDRGPFLGSAPTRQVHNHAFVGVDYDLTPGHPGLTEAEFQEVLAERETLLRGAAQLQVETARNGPFLDVNVTVRNVGAGHTLPTGFAFVRQMWLEVRATNLDTGEPVCVANVELGESGQVVDAPCVSGLIQAPQEDLPYCEPLEVQAVDPNFQNANLDIDLAPGATRPVLLAQGGQEREDGCDPWLASWQKILTDGQPDVQRQEVGFQLLEADIVENRARIFDNVVMKALEEPGRQEDAQTLLYEFPIEQVSGRVEVAAKLRFRHAPAYFLRALDGLYPNGLTADQLIQNLTVVDMAEERVEVQV